MAAPRAATTRRCARWILQRLAIDKMSVAAVDKALGLSWDTVNTIALALTRNLVFNTAGHLDSVRYLGIDERKWKHGRGQGGSRRSSSASRWTAPDPLEISCFEGNIAATTAIAPIIAGFCERHGLAGTPMVVAPPKLECSRHPTSKASTN